MNSAARRGEETAHTSLTVAPAVGRGQTSGLTAAPPTNPSHSRHHRRSALQFHTTPATIQNEKTEEFPTKESPGILTANELIIKDLNNIIETEFRIIVIKLITVLENSIKTSRESLATEINRLRNSQEELKNAINEMQNKMETTTAQIEEAEERISELEDKIMEKEEAEKKRDKKIQEYEGKIRELSDH